MIDNDKLAKAAVEMTKTAPAQRLLQDAFIAGARWAFDELDPLCNQGAEMIEDQQAELEKTRAMLGECLDIFMEIQGVDIGHKIENGAFVLPLDVRAKMSDIFSSEIAKSLSQVT